MEKKKRKKKSALALNKTVERCGDNCNHNSFILYEI